MRSWLSGKHWRHHFMVMSSVRTPPALKKFPAMGFNYDDVRVGGSTGSRVCGSVCVVAVAFASSMSRLSQCVTPAEYRSDSTLQQPMRPMTYGSSISGEKKSVVVTSFSPAPGGPTGTIDTSLRATSSPTTQRRWCSSSSWGILRPHPFIFVKSVRWKSSLITSLFVCLFVLIVLFLLVRC